MMVMVLHDMGMPLPAVTIVLLMAMTYLSADIHLMQSDDVSTSILWFLARILETLLSMILLTQVIKTKTYYSKKYYQGHDFSVPGDDVYALVDMP